MKYIYSTLAVLALLAGIFMIISAKNQAHEIEAFILWLIAAVFCVAAEIVESRPSTPKT